jgi:cell division protein ZapA (FtsZ GTPase activity inhibitor)
MQVRITIRGREYTVRGDENEEDIQALAADLDRRMAETAERTRSFDEYSVAMLTALNIASELQAMKLEVAQRLDDLDRDCATLGALLEAALPQSDADETG